MTAAAAAADASTAQIGPSIKRWSRRLIHSYDRSSSRLEKRQRGTDRFPSHTHTHTHEMNTNRGMNILVSPHKMCQLGSKESLLDGGHYSPKRTKKSSSMKTESLSMQSQSIFILRLHLDCKRKNTKTEPAIYIVMTISTSGGNENRPVAV